MSDFQGLPTGEGTEIEVPADSLAAGFLEKVPEADRKVVEQYVKDWDAGVTNKFKSIHEGYKGYKDLGEVEELKAAKQAYDLLSEDPTGVFTFMAGELKKQGIKIEDLLGITPASVQEPSKQESQQNLQGVPEEFQKKFSEIEKLVLSLAQGFQGQAQQQQEKEQQEQLTNLLTSLSEKHGDFDEDWVLLKISKGMDAEKAVQEFHSKFGKPNTFKAPPPMTGGASIPSGVQNVAEMTNGQTKDLVAAVLAAAQQQGK